MASTKREKELARQRAERQAARRAAAGHRRKQRNAILASVVAVVLLAVGISAAGLALRGGEDSESTPLAAESTAEPSSAPSTSSSPAASAAPSASAAGSAEASPSAGAPVGEEVTCTYEETGETAAREVVLPPTVGVETEQVYLVTLGTNRGDVVFEMDSAEAPCTANNLRSLAHFKYFDDTPCHRLTTEGISVLQCGDPSGSGSGGPGYQFADENLEGASYTRGTVAMANAGPGTNGSQFFLVYDDSTSLPANYTPFGTIVEGLEILEEVAEAGSDESYGSGDGKPELPLQLDTVRIKPKPA